MHVQHVRMHACIWLCACMLSYWLSEPHHMRSTLKFLFFYLLVYMADSTTNSMNELLTTY